MPIALAALQLPLTQQTTSINLGSGDGSDKPHGVGTNRSAGDKPTAAETAAAPADRVTLTAVQDMAHAADLPAAPYAEIWKGGRRLAAIDSRGNVRAFDGSVADPPGGGSGLSAAAQRTVRIARSVGGEIRVAGLTTDVSTLARHTRLREAYGY